MINKLSISNFRCFKNFELDIPSKILLISGKNNVGKTTILESLFFIFGYGLQDILIRMNLLRRNQLFAFSPDVTWEHFFYNKDLSRDIVLSCTVEDDMFKLSISNDMTYIPKISIIPQNHNFKDFHNNIPLKFSFESNTENRIGHFISFQNELSVNWEPQISRLKLPVVNYVNNSIEEIQILAQRFGKIEKLGYKETLLNILKTLEPNLKDISTIAEEIPRMYAQKETGPLLPLSVMGNGMVRLISILCSILEYPNSIVLIDEIENGFHYSFYPFLWKAIAQICKTINTQIFITTHSIECISAAANSRLNDELLSYIRLDSNDNKLISSYSFSSEELLFAVQHDIEVR